MSEITMSIDTGQGAAGVTDRPLLVVLDEAGNTNWNAAAEAFVDAISGTDIHASVGGVECDSVEEVIVQTAGSRKLVLHVNLPSCADDTTLQLATGSTTRNPSGVPAANTEGHWLLAGSGATQEDLTGQNDGTGTGLVRVDGVDGYAQQFDDAGDLVNCGSDASLDRFEAITIMAVLKWPPYQGGYRPLICRWDDGGSDDGWWFGFSGHNPNRLHFQGKDDDGQAGAHQWWPPAIGSEVHVAVTWTPRNYPFAYINGSPAGFAASNWAWGNVDELAQAGADVRIGRYATSAALQTWVDEVVVIRQALDADTIALHYRASLANDAFWTDPEAVAVGTSYRPWLMTGGRMR